MEAERIDLEVWTLRARLPLHPEGAPVLIMLHGRLGTEDVMWIFGRKIPASFTVFSPRALHPALKGGYSWVKNRASGFSSHEDFRPAVDALDGLVATLAARFPADFSKVHVMGFSQGAALGYSWAARSPGRLSSLAVLAGFPPSGLEINLGSAAWAGLPVLIAHGSQDETVPVALAEEGLRIAQSAGAEAELVTDAVGHKLGGNGMRALGDFYSGFSIVRK